MNIIYHCYGGTHSSVMAAAVHLGWLAGDKTPSREEILGVSYFDTRDNGTRGEITYMGDDARGHRVYIVGRGNSARPMLHITHRLSKIFGIEEEKYRFVDMSGHVNLCMRVGGVLSRKFKLVKMGRPLVLTGTRKAYLAIAEHVEEVKNSI